MEFGVIKTKCKYFRAAIGWIKSKVMECMNGLENKFIKASSRKTSDKDMVD